MPKKDSLMNPNGARHADNREEQSAVGDLDKDHAKCIQQSVQTVAKKLLYPSGLVAISQCTVAIASPHEDLAHEQVGR